MYPVFNRLTFLKGETHGVYLSIIVGLLSGLGGFFSRGISNIVGIDFAYTPAVVMIALYTITEVYKSKLLYDATGSAGPWKVTAFSFASNAVFTCAIEAIIQAELKSTKVLGIAMVVGSIWALQIGRNEELKKKAMKAEEAQLE